ncbi:MAG TPA: hypothetical protein VNK91_15350 [Burkholderiaceae bacterium]|nr:hypothetical protein [Burkholderiaceae bacterium]
MAVHRARDLRAEARLREHGLDERLVVVGVDLLRQLVIAEQPRQRARGAVFVSSGVALQY